MSITRPTAPASVAIGFALTLALTSWRLQLIRAQVAARHTGCRL